MAGWEVKGLAEVRILYGSQDLSGGVKGVRAKQALNTDLSDKKAFQGVALKHISGLCPHGFRRIRVGKAEVFQWLC